MSVNALEMSDDDFLNTPLESFSGENNSPVEEESVDENDTDDVSTDEEESVDETSDETEEESNSDEINDGDKPDNDEDQNTEKEEEEIDQEQEKTEVTADEQLAKLFAPFKANGRELKVESVDEAIQLMQMGANYTKKMTSLKPVLKIARMLENNGLMDEQQVSFAIDLMQKKPEAIAKLLKDSEINPLEIDLDKSSDYKGGNHIVNEAQLNVESVLEQIKDSPAYNRTINLVSKEWDDSSRQVLATNPEIIADINSHIESGIYDLIQQEMDRQKLFGGLKGLTDIQAYKVIGDKLNAEGKFDKAPAQKPSQNQEVKPKTTSNPDPKIKAKKQAAGITKGSKTDSKPDTDFNPLALSDEEFEKMFGNKL